jgi:hypothetical protein
VLGAVQGSLLRSAHARVRAWPSGLDGACAQLAGLQLRDGHSCVSSRSQATPVSGNRSRMRSIGSEGKTSATAQPPGRKLPRPWQRPRFERGRERRTSLPIPSPWSRTSDRRTALGLALHAGLRRHPFSSPINVGDASGLRGLGLKQQPEFA